MLSVERPPLDPVAAMLQREITTLAPFALHRDDLSSIKVRVTMPTYLQGTDLGCSFRHASEALFTHAVSFSNPADAAFSTLAYDMCRISSEYLSCDMPRRMMAIEHDMTRHVASASWIDLRWLSDEVGWDVLRTEPFGDADGLRQWLESLVDEHKSDIITLIENGALDSVFTGAMTTPKTASRLVGKADAVPPQSAICLGAAQGAKKLMDRQSSDCIEDQEYLNIPQRADESAGPFRPKNVAVIGHSGSVVHHQGL